MKGCRLSIRTAAKRLIVWPALKEWKGTFGRVGEKAGTLANISPVLVECGRSSLRNLYAGANPAPTTSGADRVRNHIPGVGRMVINRRGRGRVMSTEPMYRILTWDVDRQEFSPQKGVRTPVPRSKLRSATRTLRKLGYSAHRYRDPDGGHRESDAAVLIERIED